MRHFATIWLFLLLFLPGGSMGSVEIHQNLTDSFDNVIKMNVIIDNQMISLGKDNDNFENVLKTLKFSSLNKTKCITNN